MPFWKTQIQFGYFFLHIVDFQKIISNFAGYFRIQTFGTIREMISETQISYRRGGAKGIHFFHLRGIQLLIFA